VSTTAKPMTKLRRTGMRPMRANVRTVPTIAARAPYVV